MLRILLAIIASALLSGCQDPKTKVLLGGTLIASPGAAAVADSIIVVTGATIRSVGERKDTPVPQDSERVNMQGKWILPGGPEPVAPDQPGNLRIFDQAPTETTRPVRTMTAGVWVQ